ncbi:MAG: hypothetical protein CENE_00738 [Candidatus Celerinatantimonas neptuna]|nr:MAG: hypothetical protein CENE_00738 [Candidatus Celerinatantimonas neptuna]
MEPALLTVILGFQPILTLLISKDKISPIQKYGILGCVIGTLIFSFNSFSIGGANIKNILFALISLAGVTLGTILQKKRCTQYKLETNLMVQTGAASALFIICILIHGYHYSLSYSFALSVLWQGVLISFISSILLIKALSRGTVTNISTYFSCVPAATAFFSFFLLQSTISLNMLIGIFVIFISTYIVQKPDSLTHTKKIAKHE